MALQLKTRLSSLKEYLTLERQAAAKHEYYRGEIYAMAGATRKHNLIAGNVLGLLLLQLRKRPCEVYPSDMRVKIAPTGLYTYPDVVVVCGRPQFDDDERDTLLNPTVLIEVSSPSTEDYDRYVPVIIHTASKNEYLLALEKADAGEVEDFIRLIAQNLLESLHFFLQAAQGKPLDTMDMLAESVAKLQEQLRDK